MNLNHLFRLKLCFISIIFIKKWHCWIPKKVQNHTMWISTLFPHYLKHNNQVIKFCSFKMTTFCSFASSNLKILYLLIWKCHTNSKTIWSLGKKNNFEDFLKTTRKKLPDKFLVNYQKFPHNIYIIFDVNILFHIMKQRQVAWQFFWFLIAQQNWGFFRIA